MKRRLPWPASRIDAVLLHELWAEAQRQGRPITVLIRDALAQNLTKQRITA